MGRKTIKISWILFYYSLAVTACLILIFSIFISTVSPPQSNLPKYLFVLNKTSEANLIQNGNLDMPFNNVNVTIINKTNLENYYLGALLKNMPLLIVCLIAMLVLGAVVLSKILARQNEKQVLQLSKQLISIDEENAMTEQHPAIEEAYHEIKKKLDAYALDYVRLSAYVTHEQKNILSLLRAKLQISGNGAFTAEVDKVTDSLDDILTLSATKDMEKTELVDVALVCANVCDEYRKVYPKLDFSFDDEANHLIRARELWINRAVANLVSNAIKYGGSSPIQVEVTNKKGSVIVAVSDQGEGIGEEEQEKLFDYQYRVGRLNKDGYGIGLSLVKHVCELCEGLCWVENRKPHGTTFYMIFPQP